MVKKVAKPDASGEKGLGNYGSHSPLLTKKKVDTLLSKGTLKTEPTFGINSISTELEVSL